MPHTDEVGEEEDMGLAPTDAAMAIAYVAALVALGMVLSRRKASADDYFLASHSAGWPTIGLSLVASNISPTALIGITGSAYAIGISVYNYEWMATVVLVGFGAIFLPMVLRSGVYTIPEFLERRYDVRARVWFAVLTLLLTTLLDAAGALYGGAVLLQVVLPNVGLAMLIVVLAAAAGLYAITGGLRAVIYTEVVQGVVVLGSALLLAVLAVERAGGWAAIMAAVPDAQRSLIRPADDAFMPWTGLVFGAPVLGFFFWCTNQFMVQRVLAARSIADGQKGLLLAGLLKLTTLFIIVLPGLAALLLYPGLTRGDQAYPRLMFDLLPTGLVGILLAAFLGALLAQLSATYNSAATVVAMDFIKRWRPEMPERRLVRWGRIATFCCMLLSVVWAPQIDRFPSLWQYLQSVMAYTTPPVVALFVIGTMWRKATADGAFWSIMVGSGLGALLFGLFVTGAYEVQFLHVAALVFAASAVTLVVASLATADRQVVSDDVLIEGGSPRAQLAMLAPSIRIGSMALLALVGAIIFWFG